MSSGAEALARWLCDRSPAQPLSGPALAPAHSRLGLLLLDLLWGPGGGGPASLGPGQLVISGAAWEDYMFFS